ncbi:hypothetical protein B0J11DRAFT_501214 [Dendryphion nanum]|uniref:Uncharacterized protein n=1 Tax=Dendryphion nanum TaxID=256645 RepID=A0A9P9EL00_9PLEO|nr:hypothetical protein B0J11DRAFT_501214 [Dendryphion nanum]
MQSAPTNNNDGKSFETAKESEMYKRDRSQDSYVVLDATRGIFIQTTLAEAREYFNIGHPVYDYPDHRVTEWAPPLLEFKSLEAFGYQMQQIDDIEDEILKAAEKRYEESDKG